MSVKNFSIFSDVKIVFEKFNVIIGPQSSGKSLIIKLFHFMTAEITNAFVYVLREKGEWGDFISRLENLFCELFPQKLWGGKRFSIVLKFNGTKFSIHGEKKVKFTFEKNVESCFEEIKNAIEEYEQNQKKEKNASSFIWDFSFSIAVQGILQHNSLFQEWSKNAVFIPAGRSFFSMLKNNVFTFISENVGIDPYIKRFGRILEGYKERKIVENSEKNRQMWQSLLKGTYKIEKGEEFIVRNGVKIPLMNTSSGQQEILPILLVLNRERNVKNRLFFIEEPEAHIFPESQKELMDYFAQHFSQNYGDGASYVITTHSPYILSALNIEIMRAMIRNKKVNYDAQDFAAYYVDEGKVVSIVDKKSRLVQPDAIDSVSDKISSEFYEMMDLLK